MHRRAIAAAAAFAQAGGQVNVICSAQAEWCNIARTAFARTAGIEVDMSLEGSGEAIGLAGAADGRVSLLRG